MDIFDDKLALFMDKDILKETVDTSVDKGMVIAGTFFICGLGEEDFTDLPDDLAKKYEQMFYHPQAFARVNENIIAIGADGSITHVEL